MSYKCKSLVLSIAAVTTALTGCATIDMTEIASKNMTVTSNATDVNVVKRAATKLYTVFTNRGFVEKTSRNKMRSAAFMLLKGLQNQPLGDHKNYIQNVGSLNALNSDIALAQSHVEQTRSAAEIYLAMAPSENSLKEELSSLEKALMAATEANRSFTDAYEHYAGTDTSEGLMAYQEDLEGLRSVTDSFGERVRSAVMIKAPAIVG